MKKEVLLLTSTNLACNPRCLKEVRLLAAMDVSVTVVAFNLHNWTTEKEKVLNEELKGVHFFYLEATKKKLSSWLGASVIEKLSRLFLFFFKRNIFFSAMALSKRSWLLLRWAKTLTKQPNLIIAHNPAAFYAAYWLSKKKNSAFALDIEDYHPGEDAPAAVKNGAALLMKKLIPKTLYTSYASPLIKKYSDKLVASKTENGIVVNNLFPKNEFLMPVNDETGKSKIKLVWFSQYIDYNRGLETILPILDKFKDLLELTLIGNMRNDFFINELEKRKYILCKDVLAHVDLQKALSKYDIGLAIEDATTDLNRDICLTNKLWSYFQAGLYIIAGDTSAQKIFMSEHPDHGLCTNTSTEALSKMFETILINKSGIIALKNERFKQALSFNWENESLSLIKKWEKNKIHFKQSSDYDT